LHCACRRKSAVGVVQYLLEQWPGAVLIPDWEGRRLPLHNACMERESHGVTFANDEARTPMEDIQRLIEQWPKSVEVKHPTWDGMMTPLNYAAQRSPSDVTLVHWLELPWRDRKRSRKRSIVTEPEEGAEGRPTQPRRLENYTTVEYYEEFA
jgi:hypothetical protein